MEEDLVDGYDSWKKVQRPQTQPHEASAKVDDGDKAFDAQVLKPVQNALDATTSQDPETELQRRTRLAMSGAGVRGKATGDGSGSDAMREQIAKPHKDVANVYEQFLKRLSIETPEQEAARKKREASRRKWAAISDGIRAISNLWFTSQYAPHGYDSTKNWSTHLDGKLKEAAAERERNNELYLKYALGKAQAEAAGNDAVNNYDKMVAKRDRLAAELKLKQDAAARQKALEDALRPHKIRQAQEQANEAASKAGIAKFDLDHAPEKFELTQGETKSKINRNNAQAAAAYAKASSDEVYHTFMGKKYRKGSKDYDKAVYDAAKAYNEKHKADIEMAKKAKEYNENNKSKAGFVPMPIDFEPIVIDDIFINGIGKVGGRKLRKSEEIAGEVERRMAEDEKKEKLAKAQGQSGMMPGVKGKDKSKDMPGIK